MAEISLKVRCIISQNPKYYLNSIKLNKLEIRTFNIHALMFGALSSFTWKVLSDIAWRLEWVINETSWINLQNKSRIKMSERYIYKHIYVYIYNIYYIHIYIYQLPINVYMHVYIQILYIYIYPQTRVSSFPGLISVARVNE